MNYYLRGLINGKKIYAEQEHVSSCGGEIKINAYLSLNDKKMEDYLYYDDLIDIMGDSIEYSVLLLNQEQINVPAKILGLHVFSETNEEPWCEIALQLEDQRG